MLRIGQLARQTGVSEKTLRFYEEVGLLQPAARTRSGYRLYEPETAERLQLVRNAQALGFSLDDARMILTAGDAGNDPCVHTLALVERQLERVATQARRLRELRKGLLTVRERVGEGLGTCPPGGVCPCLRDGFDHPGRETNAVATRHHIRKEERHAVPMR